MLKKSALFLLLCFLCYGCNETEKLKVEVTLNEHKSNQNNQEQLITKKSVDEFGECRSGDGVFFVKHSKKEKEGFLDYEQKESIPYKLVDSLKLKEITLYNLKDTNEMYVFLLPSDPTGIKGNMTIGASILPGDIKDSTLRDEYTMAVDKSEKSILKALSERCNYNGKIRFSGSLYYKAYDLFMFNFFKDGWLTYEATYYGKFHENLIENRYYTNHSVTTYFYTKSGDVYWKIQFWGLYGRSDADSSVGLYYTPTGIPLATYKCFHNNCSPVRCLTNNKEFLGGKNGYKSTNEYLTYLNQKCLDHSANYAIYKDYSFDNKF